MTLAAYRTNQKVSKNNLIFTRRGPKNQYFVKNFFSPDKEFNFTHFEMGNLYDPISSSGRKWQKKVFS